MRQRKLFTPLNALYFSQFLSAFGDNLNFFIILGIVKRQGVMNPDAYMTDIQIGFLFVYVLLAPLVGAFADRNAKSYVLLVGNLIKSVGIALLLFGVYPILCYTIMGIGAVMYSPAKYGILTELTANEDQLLKANAKVEGSTILAILLGTVAGGILADISDAVGVLTCFLFYLASLAFTFFIPRKTGSLEVRYIPSMLGFFHDLKKVFANARARFSLIGTGAFWLTTAVLRIALIAWIPVNLGIEDTANQSMILGTTAIGVILSSLFTAKLIPARKLHRALFYGFLMVATIILGAFLPYLALTILVLLLLGFFGGVFLIPMNTMLQEVGKNLIGSGKTIAIQNFVENTFTITGLGFYMVLTAMHISIDFTIMGIGLILLMFVLYLTTQAKTVNQI